MDLKNKFIDLKKNGQVQKNDFLSSQIYDDYVFRIGIDKEKNPSILISDKYFKNSNLSKKNYRFESLEIKFNVTCIVNDIETGENLNEVFTIIKQINGNSRMHDYFLSIIEVLLNELKNDLTIEKLDAEINHLIKLFSSNKRIDEKVILGLWGELLYILNSSNIEMSILAWHNDNFELFDFSYPDFLKEIKTSTQISRIHEFNNSQLKKFSKLKVYIISIQTEKMALGKSIFDLWSEINQCCNTIEISNKLTKVISDIINSDFESIYQYKYNYLMALSTLKEFDSELIPVISPLNIPKGIIDLRLKIDLDLI